MKTCAVILLYKRMDLLKILTERLEKCGVDEIIVVRNDLINLGSAKGYGYGIELALETDCDYIWLLDDDNLPDEDALDYLKWTWCVIIDKNTVNTKYYLTKPRSALLSYRDCHKNLIKAKDIETIIGSYNACLGLNIFHPFKTRRNSKILSGVYDGQEQLTLPCATYGGIFFHLDLIKTIGLPDESYFLYCDDFEWTHRIIQKGGKIHLVKASRIEDIKSNVSIECGYYKTRNFIRFQKKLSKNKFIFYLNAVIYMILKPKLRKAILDGIRKVKQ